MLPGFRNVAGDVTLFGVGTILAKKFTPKGRVLVIGSGVGYGVPPDIGDSAKWDIRAVRGPRTAAALGLPEQKGVVDPAVMLSTLPRFADIARTDEILFVPHFRTLPRFDWSSVAEAAGVAYQSPSDDCDVVIRRIIGARAVLAESMHAAIIADAFGVPWIGIEIGDRFNQFKWGDWQESLGMKPRSAQTFFADIRRRNALRRALRRLIPAPLVAQIAPPVPLDSYSTDRLSIAAVRDLVRAALGPFRLTNRERLIQKRMQFGAILTGIRRDYGLPN